MDAVASTTFDDPESVVDTFISRATAACIDSPGPASSFESTTALQCSVI
jgi:hypothetical protein